MSYSLQAHKLQQTWLPCPNFQNSLNMSIESIILSNYLILCHLIPLLSKFPSIRFFSTESALCIKWPNYWSLSFSISPSNEYSGLISFRLECLIFLQPKGLSSVFSSTIIQFFGTQPSLSISHIRTWILEKPWLWPYGFLSALYCLCFLIHWLDLL